MAPSPCSGNGECAARVAEFPVRSDAAQVLIDAVRGKNLVLERGHSSDHSRLTILQS
jgi:hypothetical protein